MLNVEIKELVISEELKRKIDMICKFCNVNPIYHNGSIRNIKGTNIAYVEPHRIIINDITYLMFDECRYVFIGNLNNKIDIKDLDKHILNVKGGNGL